MDLRARIDRGIDRVDASGRNSWFVRELRGTSQPRERERCRAGHPPRWQGLPEQSVRYAGESDRSRVPGAVAGESGRRRSPFVRQLFERDWDPGKHPRGGYPENRGWFSPARGSSASDLIAGDFEPTPFDSVDRSRSGGDAVAWADPPDVPIEKLVDDPSFYLPSDKKGSWSVEMPKGDGIFKPHQPISYGNGQFAAEIPFKDGAPILDKFEIGKSATIVITGDPNIDFENGKAAWLKENSLKDFPPNGKLHHDLLRVTEETVDVDGKKVTVLVGKMQLIYTEIHNFLAHQGSASVGRRYYREIKADMAIIKKLAREEVLNGGKKIIARALPRLANKGVPRWAKRHMGRAYKIVGTSLTAYFFLQDLEAHGAEGAAVRAVPVLGDVVNLTDQYTGIADQTIADADNFAAVAQLELNAPIDAAKRLAAKTTVKTFDDLADKIECTNRYLDPEVINQAINTHHERLRVAYLLDLKHTKNYDFKKAAANANKEFEGALRKEAQKKTPALPHPRVF